MLFRSKENLNEVYTYDAPGAGGANHRYAVYQADDIIIENAPRLIIQFQCGPRTLVDSPTDGVIDADLLEMVKHRLEAFQAGPYASRYNEMALFHITMALEALNQRVEDRIARDVLGKEEK